jgi:hypothetical protein
MKLDSNKTSLAHALSTQYPRQHPNETSRSV